MINILISCNGKISNLTITWSILTFIGVFHGMERMVKTDNDRFNFDLIDLLLKRIHYLLWFVMFELPRTGEGNRWTRPGISGRKGRTGNRWRDTRSRPHTSRSPARGCWCWGSSSTSTGGSGRGSPPDRRVLARVHHSISEISGPRHALRHWLEYAQSLRKYRNTKSAPNMALGVMS